MTGPLPERLARWPVWVRMAGAFAIGAGAALGLAPYGIWPLALLGWACLPLLMTVAASGRQAAGIGWAFSVGFFAHGLVWIVEPFLVDIQRHGWMAPFALVFLSGGLALFWAAAFWGAYRWGRRPVHRVCLLVPMLGLAEFARAYLFTGFPWAAPAQALIESPMLPLLAWIGPHGLGLWALAAACGIGVTAMGTSRLALLPAVALSLASAAAMATRAEVEMTGQTVRLIQPNAAQHLKWDPNWIPVFFQRQLELTAEGPRPDLIVWSESAIAPVYERAAPHLAAIAEAAGGAQVALGIRRYEGGRFYNALVRLDSNGRAAGIYDKHHLVPFGEYIPLGGIAKRFGIQGLAAEDGDGYSAGPGPEVMDFGALGHAVPLICYEAVFPQDVHGAPARPAFLLQITNDAWFGTYIGPYQHLAQARMRAVEQGVPMLRAANTGISAVIDPHGVIRDSLALGEVGYVQSELPAPLQATFYGRTGDLPWVVVTIVLLGVAISFTSRNQS